ncbi:MAG: hypothetical protein A3E07_01005 [Candidatus Wildermuthbacteria bacterium RIFCSPHIGHO2_12_FULL_45_9]|uniref:Response regulatory domain-containing protein n=1 Tax=Candidatus Wildermuthbacteria bacterium RIFCSPHIGHO2_02_FULL_45_25 TaxID=1802450 RepID=A0A1G2R2Y0_9BACT|nr:MAG: hypothetical protein A2748_03385 [Candidatus Wildermuthbacteria bacterium RIFCSPHIGHO2_01_FULL_45_20]OHA66612.1 MAG: hypothetical protein A3C04_00450 [Candidatus Wildermuthbacteria bacterium RIFCSPHIGHO2_02_FULL_45_25]OHA71519.1 MAG: hypothetical protein A3E07_01005 [Candidatus Wildermuthbacteria bacterium RIFCSPHIGHO2_12_FULL_45_9]
MQKMLLVEDDPLLIDIYTTKLKESGFEVKVIEDGADVLTHMKKEKPDLVLLDIVLPHQDGWEILRQAQEDPETKDMKIVVLSNLGQQEEINKGLQLGAVKYLIKAHYTPSEIVEEIKAILAQEQVND